jgi:hypothetical protein
MIDSTTIMTREQAIKDRNRIVGVSFTATHVALTLKDNRILCVPLAWYPPLQAANEESRNSYEIYSGAVIWHELDAAIDLEAVLEAKYGW